MKGINYYILVTSISNWYLLRDLTIVQSHHHQK